MTTYKTWTGAAAVFLAALFVVLGVSMTAFASPALKSVYIHKYIDGVAASTTAATASFPMVTTYSSQNLGSAVDAPFTLSPSGWGPGDVAYQASFFRDSIFGASYATHEVVGGDTVGASCEAGKPYALVGYTTGTTLAQAEDATPSTTAPNFSSLVNNSTYVIVWNKSCNTPPAPACSLTVVSDSTTKVGESNAVAVTPNAAWTASIPGATWIYDEALDSNGSSQTESPVVFTKTFGVVGAPVDASLTVAADNMYTVKVNGAVLPTGTSGTDLDNFHSGNEDTWTVPAGMLHTGANTLEITVTNPGTNPDGGAAFGNPNPGGLLYKLTLQNENCPSSNPGGEGDVKVHIYKYMKNGEALTQVPDASELPPFPMQASWKATIGGNAQTVVDADYVLGDNHGSAALKYAADTSPMKSPVIMYKTHEVTGPGEGDMVLSIGAQCAPNKFRLVGYKSGTSLPAALSAVTMSDAPQFDNFIADQYVVVINEDCDDVLAPQVSTVTMCKVDDTGATPLSGWTLTLKGDNIEDLVVPTNTSAGINSTNLLANGTSYLATVVGTWFNTGQPNNEVDAEYSTQNNWANHTDGFTGYSTNILELQINSAFDPNSNWGTYNAAHTYTQSFLGTGAPSNFRIFDGNGTTQEEGWFGDNSGTLAVNISKGFSGITGANGCTTFNNVPYGTYTAGEVAQEGWTNASGVGPVVVDGSSETFTIVNHNNNEVPSGPTTATITVTGNTSAGENQPGWLFNRDTSTETPFNFQAGNASIGSGSLFVPPITNTVHGNSDKFIGELFLLAPLADINSISYDYKIASGGEVADKDHFYMSVYANFGESSPTKFYDCRYSVVPTIGVVDGYTTVTFDPTLSYPVTTRTDNILTVENETSPHPCPASPSGMDALDVGSPTIRAVALNVGDTSGSDTGISGYLDKVVVNKDTNTNITTYDFEPEVVTNTSETVVVTPIALGGWAFNRDRDTWSMGTGEFVSGPATAPLPIGSARLTTPTNDERTVLRKYLVAGTKISDIKELKYSTYRAEPAGGVLAPALQFDVDMDSTPVNPLKADGRIVYEPYYTQTVLDDTWQTWDALDDTAGTGTGNWWIAGPNGGASCTIANPCTWTELKTNYPGLRISAESLENQNTEGAMLFKAGGSWAGFDGNVDKFVFGLKTGSNIDTTTYDFEPASQTDDTPTITTTGGGSSGTSFRRGVSTGRGEVQGASTGPNECSPFLTTYMRLGGANDPAQVMLLQNFLNGEMGTTLAVSGVFDAATDAAVRAFQAKYAQEILPPWELSGPTGWVYILTQWKINDIVCPGTPKPGVTPFGPGGMGGMGDATSAPGKQDDGIAAGVVLGANGQATSSETASSSAVARTQTAALNLAGYDVPSWLWLLVLAGILIGGSSWYAYRTNRPQA